MGKIPRNGFVFESLNFSFVLQTLKLTTFVSIFPQLKNVFEMGIMLPGRCDVNQAAARPFRLQLGTVLGSSVNKESSSCYKVYGDTI
jgi:hypothetical protein